MSLFKTNEKNTVDLMGLLPEDHDTLPKIRTSVKPSDAATFCKVVKGALRKVPHCDPTVSRGIGMLELVCESPDWTTTVNDINKKRTDAGLTTHAYPTVPDPGTEPDKPDATDVSIPSGVVSAKIAARKIWQEKCEARQHRDAVEMALLKLIANQFPTHSQRLFDDTGFFPCDQTAINVWTRDK